MKLVTQHTRNAAPKNDTKHDRVSKSISEIKDHAMYFPNAPLTYLDNIRSGSRAQLP